MIVLLDQRKPFIPHKALLLVLVVELLIGDVVARYELGVLYFDLRVVENVVVVVDVFYYFDRLLLQRLLLRLGGAVPPRVHTTT